ncbi:MAG: Frizzy aggregation protein FrzB [Myxococcaceae bacterium]|nr:Frizzy aggregation protein FrzB [Myxococcaceae bacterium]
MSARVDIVVFEIGGLRYGADMTQVRRIDRLEPDASVGAPLGKPFEGRRALVFCPDGDRELHLAIDTVLAVQSVPPDDLRRLPPAVGPSPFIIGAWLDRDAAVLLVDLFATNPFRPTEAPNA